MLLAISLSDAGGARGGLWLVLGAGCLAAYYGYPTKYKILPSDKGNLLVLEHGETAGRIESEIEQRRAAQFREQYDFFPDSDTPAQLRNRFNWLHREGALGDDELQERLARVESIEQGAAVHIAEPEVRALN